MKKSPKEKKRERERDRKLKATAEERFQRLAADRIYRKERRDTEDEQERSQRLDALKTYVAASSKSKQMGAS